MKKIIIGLCIIMSANISFAQNDGKKFFAGYETLEMAMNKFQYFAGELGYQFDKKNQVRLSVMEVNLTERHLSSKYEAAAVDGKNVEGYFRGYELHYDWFFSKHWYVSANIGYYNDTYKHTVLDEKVENETLTLGSGIGYRRSNLFGIKHLYLNLSIPVRFYFNKINETKLGDTTVMEHVIVNNLWLFLGYEF